MSQQTSYQPAFVALVTECCGIPPIEGTECEFGGVWAGRCQRCKEMAFLFRALVWEEYDV